MRCCVPLCDISSETLVSKSREGFKPKAVTFHGFPTVARLKEIWLTNLGLDKCNLPQGAVVCSQHFNNDNFYFTKANFRKLRYDAVPLEVVSKEAQFCVICLDTDCTLYPLRKHNLHKAYSKLTGVSTVHKLKNVLKLCTECAQRLINCCKLEDKSLIARNLMLQLVGQHGQLTTQNVRAINRVENKLTSDLVQRISKPDYFGPYIRDNLEDLDVKKKELKSFDKEDLNVKSEMSDHNYSKLDDEIESDVDYEIECLNEFEGMCDDDIKMNSKIVDDDKAKSCKVNKSTSSYDLTNHVETNSKLNGDSDELEGMHDNDVKTNNNIVDDDKLNDEIDSDVDYEIERLSEFEEMYDDDDDIKMKNRIVDDDDIKTRKVIAYTSTYGLAKDVDSDNFDGDYDDKHDDDDDDNKIVDDDDEVKSFEVEYLNNYFGEDIEYLQEDIEHVALALGAKDIFGRNRCGNNAAKQISTKRQENEKCDLKIFQITRLSQEEAVAEIMKRKTQKAYLNSTYRCTDCYKGYSNKEAFDSHMERHTEKFGPLTCEVCKTHKWDIKQLKHHQRNFHSLKYSCTLCPFVKTNKAMAVMHERWHRGLKYQCPYCCAEFIKHSTYMSHLRSKHPSDVICSLCGFSFVGQQGLESHKSKMHPFTEPAELTDGPTCRRCGVQFASEAAFRQHLDVSPRHVDDGSDDSDDAFQYQVFGNQNRKKQIKHYRNIICEESPLLQCGEQVVGFRRYYRHLMQHGRTSTKYRGETAMCEHCGKLFKSHTLLQYHMPLHSGKRQFPCEVCGKRFVLRKHLWFHSHTHRPDRPRYACELCGKHFANKMGRARHKRIIHEAVKYTCDLCGKKFTTAFARKNHIIHVHGKVPWPKRVREPRTRKPKPQARRTDTTSDSDMP